MSKPAAHAYDEQILDLLDGNLSEDKQAELHAWLSGSPAHWDRFAHLSFLHNQIANQLNNQRSSDGVRLDALKAEPVEAELPPIHIASSDALTKQQYISALTYVLKHTFTPKRIATLATAAVVLLGVVLAIVLMTGPGENEQIAKQPSSEPDAPDVAASAVATLTATHNAAWDQQPGKDLYPGQRLTLTQGFAEITTAQGAIAILEAPASIELLDHNNALRLHAGKLVGICETESSQGFLIRTPHMDITDLGTRFGVDATQHEATEVHVYEGVVKVTRPNPAAPGQLITQRLIQGQAVQAEEETPAFVAIEPAYERFASGVGVYRLPGTGYQLDRTDRVDPEWNLIEVDGQRLENKVPLAIGTPPGLSTLTPNDPDGSRWLEVTNTEQYQGDQEALYTIQTLFVVPRDVDIETAVLRIDFHADDRLEGIAFSGRPYAKWRDIEQPANGKGTALIPLRDILIAKGINGVHFRVKNAPNSKFFLNIAWQIEYPASDLPN